MCFPIKTPALRGKGGFPFRTLLGKREVLQSSALFGAKKLWIFRNLWYVVQKMDGSLSQCGYFVDKKGRKVIFRDFVQMSFMDGPLYKKKKRQ